MARLTKTFLTLVLSAACSTTAVARQNELPPIFPSKLSEVIDRNARQSAAPFKMMPVRQIATPVQLPVANGTQQRPTQQRPTQQRPTQPHPTQQPEQVVNVQPPMEHGPGNPGSTAAQPTQSSPSDVASHNSTLMLGAPPTAGSDPISNGPTLNHPQHQQPEFGTVMMFPAQNGVQPNGVQPNDAPPAIVPYQSSQSNIARPYVDPTPAVVGQLLPPQNSNQNSIQNMGQPATPRHSPFMLASSRYQPNPEPLRPQPGIYVAPKYQPPELTDPPPEPAAPPAREEAPPQPTALTQRKPGKFILPQMSDFPPLKTELAPSQTPRAAAPLRQVLETSIIGPEMLVRDVPDVFEIVVLNTSEQPATNIVIQMTVPEDLTVTELDRKAWLDSETRTVSWSIDELPGGTKEVIRYSSVSGTAGQHEQSITIGMQDSFQGQTSFETIVIQNDDYENIEHPGFEDG